MKLAFNNKIQKRLLKPTMEETLEGKHATGRQWLSKRTTSWVGQYITCQTAPLCHTT